MKRKFYLPRLGRRGKAARNLLIGLFLLAVLWGRWAYSLPTREMNFRRLERYYLLPVGELVYRSEDLFVDEGEGQAVAGRVPVRSRPTGWNSSSDLWVCPLDDGPSPVPLSDDRVLFLRMPETAARAELILMAAGEAATAAGELADGGLWEFTFPRRFRADCPSFSSHNGVEGWPYVLRLWDEAGSLLLEREGAVPLAIHRSFLSGSLDDCADQKTWG